MISELLVNLALLEQKGIDCRWGVNLKGDPGVFERVSLPYLLKRFGKPTLLPRDIREFVDGILG
jgi:hypothetical protein